jgi:hypothetical protein
LRRTIIYIILIFLLSVNTVKGQSDYPDITSNLGNLFSRLVSNYDDIVRLRINDSIRLLIDDYITSDSVFNHRFRNLRYLGQITSPDSLLKIVTWNLVLGDNPGKYFCYFIRKQEYGKPNKIYRLTATYNESSLKTDTTYNESAWYGALYYDIKPYIIGEKKCWILLGIDYGNPYVSRKIIDVISFTPEGPILFGKKWFASEEKTKFRDVFEYASNGMMSLRFRSDSSIVFDHLVPFSPVQKGDHQYYGPDYSFDAYNFENGLWRLKINVDARNNE